MSIKLPENCRSTPVTVIIMIMSEAMGSITDIQHPSSPGVCGPVSLSINLRSSYIYRNRTTVTRCRTATAGTMATLH